ncbi:SDR family NAD(P)-dependent oxidoreductase [Microbacterium gorillae]|uniref:SDR family NAD(P)-dependent oxidoreductase n=1 Tax=Microbacterium gorillae TaxID=1231063 RepID=UPI00058BDC72|nr:SDR family oxidoreductase [Microbacterium gorillae]
MAKTALITGASSGLGAEYARQLTERGGNLVLVARDRAALEALATQLRARGAEVEVLVADLLKPRQRRAVEERLRDASRPIDLLINNAGFGLPLDFATVDIKREIDHLALHVEVPMRLMHAVLPVMRERGGRILNVASIAAFIPRSTYGAVKSWVISFSRWANQYYDRVTVTAVCPGYTHTNFHERLGLPPGKEGVPDAMWLDAPLVVRESLRDLARGKSVSIPSLRYKVLAALTSVVPDSLLTRLGTRGR